MGFSLAIFFLAALATADGDPKAGGNPDEAEQSEEEGWAEEWKRMDVDGDGKVTLKELLAEEGDEPAEDMPAEEKEKLNENFKKADADGNGGLSFEEFQEMIKLFG